MADNRKTVLITGCTTGSIGEAFAKECHGRGLRVFATSRNLETMDTLAAIGIETLPLDVTRTESIRQAKAIISERTSGKLDLLINNAGIAYAASVSDLSMEEVRRLFDVNLFGHMAVTQEFLPLLTAASSACIVMIASLAGMMPVPYNCAYNASKAALLSFGDTLRVELAPFGIKVLNIAAGNVESNIMKGAPTSLPEGSIYCPVNEEFVRDRIQNFQAGATPADEFARTVIGEALKSSPRAIILTANNAWTFWFVNTFAGRTGFDFVLSRIFGLAKLKVIKDAERKTKGGQSS